MEEEERPAHLPQEEIRQAEFTARPNKNVRV